MKFAASCFLLIAMFCLQSCEFSCSVGNADKEVKGASKEQDGARIYNNIELRTTDLKLTRAYLQLEDGKRVPDDNFVDFTQPVKLIMIIENGWTVKDEKVLLGASETITSEDGTVLLDEQDLFSKYPEGVSEKDANQLSLSATIKLLPNTPPTTFTVAFRIWDKNGTGVVEGSYKIYSK